jgi:hypothetical protein
MYKYLPTIFILAGLACLMSSCTIARQPNWYYYRGGYFTYKTNPIYNRDGHWKGGKRNYTDGHTHKSYYRVVKCPRR